MGPLLYALLNADIPQPTGVNSATFVDDTAILSTHDN